MKDNHYTTIQFNLKHDDIMECIDGDVWLLIPYDKKYPKRTIQYLKTYNKSFVKMLYQTVGLLWTQTTSMSVSLIFTMTEQNK
jgi:hypothetical protein